MHSIIQFTISHIIIRCLFVWSWPFNCADDKLIENQSNKSNNLRHKLLVTIKKTMVKTSVNERYWREYYGCCKTRHLVRARQVHNNTSRFANMNKPVSARWCPFDVIEGKCVCVCWIGNKMIVRTCLRHNLRFHNLYTTLGTAKLLRVMFAWKSEKSHSDTQHKRTNKNVNSAKSKITKIKQP